MLKRRQKRRAQSQPVQHSEAASHLKTTKTRAGEAAQRPGSVGPSPLAYRRRDLDHGAARRPHVPARPPGFRQRLGGGAAPRHGACARRGAGAVSRAHPRCIASRDNGRLEKPPREGEEGKKKTQMRPHQVIQDRQWGRRVTKQQQKSPSPDGSGGPPPSRDCRPREGSGLALTSL